MNQILEEIGKIGIVPVIAIEDVKDAAPLAGALIRGGIPCAEITFRTAAAQEAIRTISAEYPEMLVGAGTVLTTRQVDEAVSAGAKFIVSPGLNPNVVSYCVEKNIPVTPGCSCPSDVERAIELGLDVVKFFPAEAAGGLAMIKAMAAPYHQVKFMPTGGVSAKNLNEYLSFEKVIACGGSWMVSKDLIAAKDWTRIEELTREAVRVMLGFELVHVGINAENEEDALAGARLFETVFGFPVKEGAKSVFAGTVVELMKTPFKGRNGHLAIGVNSVDRAVWHLERQGVRFAQETAGQDEKGRFKSIYLAEEFAGFAVHLILK